MTPTQVSLPSSSALGVIAHFLLPWRTRRKIFLSSLCGAISSQSMDRAHIAELNKAMNLPGGTFGSQVQMAMNGVVWKKRVGDVYVEERCLHLRDLAREDLSDTERDALIQRVLAKMPRWLHYAKGSYISYDISRLIHTLQEQKLQPA